MKRTSTTQYLLRFDDICPTMNWRVWAEIETVLVQRRFKPLLAVVPDNRDPGLQVDPPAGDFWDRVRAWQDRGWTIALHGFQHRYVTRNAGMVAVRKKSEFAGLQADVQREKLRRGVEIFERERITSRVWVAPGNSFDAATVALLPEFDIRVISAGYFRHPYSWLPPKNLPPTNPPLTAPRRGTGQPALVPSWEGLGVGSGAQCPRKVRGIPTSSLSPSTVRRAAAEDGADGERG